MSKLRLLILVFGPIPIVAGSFTLSQWVRSDPDLAVRKNLVVVRGQEPLDEGDWALEPRRAANPGSPAAPQLDKACRAVAADVSRQLGPAGHAIVRPPFVVAGNLSEAELDGWHRRTIGPAARSMASAYFSVPPDRPITVLLFAGARSYSDAAKKLYGEEGVSVYGYYKPNLRTLVMNIDTGGGTLVHELTHALAAFDFPELPDWFNEGLASLHEQCRIREDESGLEGLVNWRLAALQEAIHENRLRSLASLIGGDFRGETEALNYAQARYFCLYMQRQGVLGDYYRKFRARHRQDPLGLATVAGVFPDQTWDELDRGFRRWVLALKR
ncbi:MAG: hypothetical protein ACYC35_08180 [Pirellulales bacterium]